MSFTQWRETKYDQVFEATLRGLAGRRSSDPSFSVADAESTLNHLYIREGNDQDGRGEVQDAMLSAVIDAYERFIAEWKGSVKAEEQVWQSK